MNNFTDKKERIFKNIGVEVGKEALKK